MHLSNEGFSIILIIRGRLGVKYFAHLNTIIIQQNIIVRTNEGQIMESLKERNTPPPPVNCIYCHYDTSMFLRIFYLTSGDRMKYLLIKQYKDLN